MEVIRTCVNRQEERCTIFKEECKRNYNPQDFLNNLNCRYHHQVNIVTFEVKNREGFIGRIVDYLMVTKLKVREHYKKITKNFKETATIAYKNRKSLDELLKKFM